MWSKLNQKNKQTKGICHLELRKVKSKKVSSVATKWAVNRVQLCLKANRFHERVVLLCSLKVPVLSSANLKIQAHLHLYQEAL